MRSTFTLFCSSIKSHWEYCIDMSKVRNKSFKHNLGNQFFLLCILKKWMQQVEKRACQTTLKMLLEKSLQKMTDAVKWFFFKQFSKCY